MFLVLDYFARKSLYTTIWTDSVYAQYMYVHIGIHTINILGEVVE